MTCLLGNDDGVLRTDSSVYEFLDRSCCDAARADPSLPHERDEELRRHVPVDGVVAEVRPRAFRVGCEQFVEVEEGQVNAIQEAVTGWIKKFWRSDELEEASAWIQPPGCGIGRSLHRRRVDLPHSLKLGIKLCIWPVAPLAVCVTPHLLVLNEDEGVALEMTVDQVDTQDPFKFRRVDITDMQKPLAVGEEPPVAPVAGQWLPMGEAARVVAAQHLFARRVSQRVEVTALSSRIPGSGVVYIDAGEERAR